MHTTDQWSGIFRYSSTPSLTQISCWYWEAMACVRSGSNTWLSAVTWLIWPSVIKNHSCRHSTFRTNCYGTFDWQPSRYLHWPTVFAWRNSYSKKSAIFYCDPFDGNVQKLSRRRIPLRGSHVDDSGSCMSSPEQEKGERICVALDIRSWLLVSRKPLLFRGGPIPTTKSHAGPWLYR